MKKNSLLIWMTLFAVQFSSAQDYVKQASDKICECAKEIESPTFLKIIDKCYKSKEVAEITEKALQERTKKAKDSTYDAGYKKGYEMGQEILGSLMTQCERFYEAFQIAREEGVENMKGKTTKSELDSLNKIESISFDFLFNRGTKNFAYGHYDLALKDFNRVLRIQEDFSGAFFFIGWIYEKRKDFEKALEYYRKSYAIAKNNNVLLVINALSNKYENK